MQLNDLLVTKQSQHRINWPPAINVARHACSVNEPTWHQEAFFCFGDGPEMENRKVGSGRASTKRGAKNKAAAQAFAHLKEIL